MIYIPNYSKYDLTDDLMTLVWLNVSDNRKEYFMANGGSLRYTYSNRTYIAKPFLKSVKELMDKINKEFNSKYNICFLNRYDDKHDWLGWHSDKADEVAVVSFGQPREIWWREIGKKGSPDGKQLLESKSLFIMESGFQDKYVHKIPKADREVGRRISLTFRYYEEII